MVGPGVAAELAPRLERIRADRGLKLYVVSKEEVGCA